MLNNVMNNALSGVNAAQGGLSVISNNLANAGVGYYHRQSAVFGENPGTMTPNGYFGNGTYFSHVRREFDEFVNAQYSQSRARSGDYEAYVKNCNKVDDLLTNDVEDLSSSIGSFFTALDTASSDASDKTLIDVFLGQSNALVSQFKEADRRLQEMERDINHQIENKVKDINIYADKIAGLNQQIARIRSVSGSEPNDLLDVRDRLVNEVNSVIGVKVIEQNGNYNVTFANGLPLVTGEKANRLEAVPSSKDDSRFSIGFVGSNGQVREIPDEAFKGGELSGVLRSRQEVIDPAYQKINKLALVFATKFNEIHSKGFDSNGNTGKDFFALGKGTVVSNTHNTGKTDFDLSYSDVSKVTGNNYEMRYDGTNWNVTRLPDGVKITVDPSSTADTLKFEGLELKMTTNTPAAGDTFVVKPMNGVINNMETLVTEASGFAGAGSKDGGPGDNENIKELVKLQDQKVVDGGSTFSDFYATLINDVGSRTKQAQIDSETQNKMTESFYRQEQEISGVNMNEESIQMQKIQQFFNANAQVLKTVDDLFNALMRAF
ncbi:MULTISPECIES: flagellar hook-associated protein FlgK [Providencia]|uniref:Flagellar hook-associated protein 1 n=2 Tax=Providencia rustigianii TaxID=158850 RepID=D1NZJ7_9GAMM|nr:MULTISPECIES: flagellar hook-associated protein FlgK [Providencia]EFB73263.1 flagellar hook-associated protein FlgK [Providencia rustigianii DSM 4541]MTC57086.1 flagellar hook-associated protein FlgK [Providencia rustigianii]MTC60327.1 flagellar hook-associated protein FlgK [Providencia rustigianii]SUC35149.1 Flagellar hook-associated protein 1 [Providencia rustigianii]VEH54967.1 Flagellar hook-associated protein 1 [Providencia rustigianii]